MINKKDRTNIKDFSKYEFNNWKKVDNNRILNMIDKKGGSIWINSLGVLAYRLSKKTPILTSKNIKQVNLVFTNYLDTEVNLLEEVKKKKEADNTLTNEDIAPSNISVKEIKLIQSDQFNPYILQEFYKKNDLYYRNIFKPTKYLQLQPSQKSNTVSSQTFEELAFESIKRLIMNLVNNDIYRFDYVINWLAYFFQDLKKSQVALVLRGNQGSGKGMFFNEVIKPLFGEDYCTTVNDKSFRSSFLGGIIENKIFFNLDEISHQKAESVSIKNFLKALVTNDTITAEKKFITLDNETKIYGQVLITSNEPYVLDVEHSDRRYTIFNTGDNLINNEYLGYGIYQNLSEQIKKELKSFAIYLKKYRVNRKLANKALPTPEKMQLQEINKQKELQKQQRIQKDMYLDQTPKVDDSIISFAQAIRLRNKNYFDIIKYDNSELHQDIIEDLSKNMFKIKNLLPCFQLIHGNQLRIKYVSILIKELTKFDPFQFDHTNYKSHKEDEELVDHIFIIPYTI